MVRFPAHSAVMPNPQPTAPGFLDCLRNEVEPKHGIKVSIVCPGVVQTQINASRLHGGGDKAPLSLDMKNAMTSEKAASILINALVYGEREVLYELGWAMTVKHFFPSLFDFLARRQFSKKQKSDN